jgi:hypothetical protein
MTMNDWLYNGETYTDPGEYYGFVYIITNKINGRKYIGKKFFWAIKRRQVNKIRKRYKAESDWKEYWSSSDELKLDIEKLGKENFSKEIIHLCKSKGVTNYLEAKEQFKRNVLENNVEWYNTWIMVRVNRSHLNKLK